MTAEGEEENRSFWRTWSLSAWDYYLRNSQKTTMEFNNTHTILVPAIGTQSQNIREPLPGAVMVYIGAGRTSYLMQSKYLTHIYLFRENFFGNPWPYFNLN